MATETALSPGIMPDPVLQKLGLPRGHDDWTGSTGSKRRKLQNRINQRAHREFSRRFELGIRSNF